jgi:hypothetical protein
MNPFKWKLAKLMNGKPNLQIVREKDGLKEWNRDAPDWIGNGDCRQKKL